MSDPHSTKPEGHDDLLHPDHAHIKKHVRAYKMVGASLIVLTVVTVLVSYVHFGDIDSNAGNITVALIIAAFKASLVAAIFMHLNAEKWTIYRFMLVTCFFAIALFLLTLLAEWDHLSKVKIIGL